MRSVVYIAASLGVVAAIYYSGILNATNVTHPAWRNNAFLYGSLGGAVLSAFGFWFCAMKPRFGRWLERGVILAFVIALGVALVNAQVFIAAEDYDPVAIGWWHKASYAVFVTFVPSLATLLTKLRIIGSRQGQ